MEVIKIILNYKNHAQNLFYRASKFDKKKSKPKAEKSIAERTKLRRQKLDIIAKKKRKNKQYNV